MCFSVFKVGPHRGEKMEDRNMNVPQNRIEMLSHLKSVINQCEHKLENGRIRKPEHDKVRIQYYRCMIYAISTARSLLNDHKLKEIEERIEALEEKK